MSMTPLELAKEAAKILDDKKAIDLKIIGIKDISVLADYFVLATGTSSTHVKSLADEIEFQLKQLGKSADHVEGYRSNSWVLLDYGSVIIHVFTSDAREFYNLDRLWQDGEIVDISDIQK
ncbi:MAG: ribosome silencing factor [Eubacteriales bacterium]|jgi:ribosome-associated protein